MWELSVDEQQKDEGKRKEKTEEHWTTVWDGGSRGELGLVMALPAAALRWAGLMGGGFGAV